MTAPRRRWFRFSLRTLFVVVTACGLWLGWQVRIVHERKAVLAALERLGKDAFQDRYDADIPESEYAKTSLVRRLLGDETCVCMWLPRSIGGEWIARAEVAFPESRLWIIQSEDHPARYAFRDSLYSPNRQPNRGTLFKTGIPDPNATGE